MTLTHSEIEERAGLGAEIPTLLIVDDELGILESYQTYLTPTGGEGVVRSARRGPRNAPSSSVTEYRLLLADTGEKAVALVRAEHEKGRRICGGFFDMKMPGGIDGLETIRRIREIDSGILSVIVTAYQDRSLDDIASAFGPDATDTWDYLNKPFTSNEIVQKARNITASWLRRRREEAYAGALNSANASLEHRVEERTRDLASANKDLEEALSAVETANDRLRTEMVERERVEAELLLAQKLEAVGQLAAGIAHEINTPIQYIGDNTQFVQSAFDGYTTVLGRFDALLAAIKASAATAELVDAVDAARTEADIEFLSEEVPDAIEQALEGIDQVATIVRAMKEFAHPGSKEKTPVDINRAVHTSVTVTRNEWKYVADIEFDLDDELPMVSALAGELNQVFLNLVVNAAHAIANVVDSDSSKGTISVATRLCDEGVEIRISDTGTGIPEDILDKVFTPFFTTKEVGKGTGQGLAIARSVVVDKHDGLLDVESEVGVGTTFTVRLPCEASAD